MFKYPSFLITLTVSIMILISACSFFEDGQTWQRRKVSSNKDDIYTNEIKPIFDNRCVVCHSCYNAPCQLKLSSYEGLMRGANKDNIYQYNVFKPKKLTRLFEDAHTTKQWQDDFGFFPVLKHDSNGEINLKESVLLQMLLIKDQYKDNKKQEIHPTNLPNYQAEQSRSCPKIDYNNHDFQNNLHEIISYQKKTPWGGMPYGFPKLTESELGKLYEWISMGAPGPVVNQSFDVSSNVKRWEEFFNNSQMKYKVTARYIYEHLVFGHLYFEDEPNTFYRLIRAKNKTGKPDIIATRRPFDSPGSKDFYYRFEKITSTIVHKTHILYKLSDEKLERFNELFIKSDWNVPLIKLPSYDIKTAANPFVTFEQIPAKSRYQFLLDDAHYHVMTFIRGPVCLGQGAVNVIDDNFWVMFIDPESDIFVNNESLLDDTKKLASPPAVYGSSMDIRALTKFYKDSASDKNKLRFVKNELLDKYRPQGFGVNDIWDGDGHNNNALLTVFRNFDSATVVTGAKGQVPKTVWVMDYLIFEDIYYNLVAGYDVYGSSFHQLKTRIHMNSSRINSQDNFLDFLPQEARERTRFEWSRSSDSKFQPRKKGAKVRFPTFKQLKYNFINRDAAKKMSYLYPYLGGDRPSQVKYQTKNYKEELLEQIFQTRFNEQVRGELDTINCCSTNEQSEIADNITNQKSFEIQARKVFGKTGRYTRYFPELALVRIKTEDPKNDLVYTLVHNHAHWNVNFIFKEGDRMRPGHDTLNLFPGYVGSYPNYFFVVDLKQTPQFLKDLKDISRTSEFRDFAKKYGISRMNPQFWNNFDFFQNRFYESDPIASGVLDMNRYQNY